MNLQTLKPRARLVRDPEQRHLTFWRVCFPGGCPAFDRDFAAALRLAYRLRLNLLTARNGA